LELLKREDMMKNMTKEEMDHLLKTVGDGVMALSSGDAPYCIPFGFVYIKDTVYLSLFPMGRKWEIINKNNRVCFNVFCWNDDHSEWSSVVIDGRIVQVRELQEIELVVKANMEKVGLDPATYLDKRMAMYRKTIDNPAALKIFRIEAERMGGKKMKTLIGS
jgi:nitroimidazol reductase NimA-like FMN-containing flavoprotein (pyridoxamine 5'-phosphate oxidase superfamily)